MQRCTAKARYEFISLFMKHAVMSGEQTEGDLQRAATKLLRYGATLGRIAEQSCNGPACPNGLTPEQYNRIQARWDKWQEREEVKEARIEAHASKLCAEFGCTAIFQGDPRGNTLKIRVPSGYTNDWGKDGICVPTS